MRKMRDSDKTSAGVDFLTIHGIMLTHKDIVSTSDSMCAQAHEIMV